MCVRERTMRVCRAMRLMTAGNASAVTKGDGSRANSSSDGSATSMHDLSHVTSERTRKESVS